jgi:hypothetical protein
MEGDPFSRFSTTHYDYGRWYYEKNKNSNREVIPNNEGINNNNYIENNQIQDEQINQNIIKEDKEPVNS